MSPALWLEWAEMYLIPFAIVTVLVLASTGKRGRWWIAGGFSLVYICYWVLGILGRQWVYEFSPEHDPFPGFYMPLWLAAGLLAIWVLCWLWPWRFVSDPSDSVSRDDRLRGFPVVLKKSPADGPS
jgi:hypothetical protein